MKISQEANLISAGVFSQSDEWAQIRESIHAATRRVEHPRGSGTFTIYPESGKKRGEGNGVRPIKVGMMLDLQRLGWTIEGPAKNALGHRLGSYDAALQGSVLPVVVEWETGNISSSHRSVNKMTMLLAQGIISAGILIVPTKRLARFLTDRIGNFEELAGFWDFWKGYPVESGVLEVIGIEQDAESTSVPRIPKATDGRAAV